MSTKSHYVMFAIAAFAIGGIMTPSAFAVSEYADVNVGTSGTATSDFETISCGTAGTCVAQISGSASQDFYKIWYGMTGSQTTCSVTSISTGSQGSHTENWGTIAGLHSYQYDENVDANEVVTVGNIYSSCS